MLDGGTYPGWKMTCFWLIKLCMSREKRSRLSLRTSNAIYNWRSPVYSWQRQPRNKVHLFLCFSFCLCLWWNWFRVPTQMREIIKFNFLKLRRKLFENRKRNCFRKKVIFIAGETFQAAAKLAPCLSVLEHVDRKPLFRVDDFWMLDNSIRAQWSEAFMRL